MSITHDDLYIAALKLSEEGTEAAWRSSASRAYYAAYHRCQASAEVCVDKNAHLEMGSHQRLSERYSNHDTKAAKAISYVLVTMKRTRHSADYDIGDAFDKGIATSQLAQYRALLDRLNSFDLVNSQKTA